jgi:hypothetical protein
MPKHGWDEKAATAEWNRVLGLGTGKKIKKKRRWWKLPFKPHAPYVAPRLHAIDATGATDPVDRDGMGELLFLTSSRGRLALEKIALMLEV